VAVTWQILIVLLLLPSRILVHPQMMYLDEESIIGLVHLSAKFSLQLDIADHFNEIRINRLITFAPLKVQAEVRSLKFDS